MKSLEFTKRNIRRTPYQAIAATMVMFLTFLTMLVFLILAMGTQKIIQSFENKPQVLAFFRDGTTASDINAIANALQQTGKVTKIHHVSHEEALKIYKDNNKNEPQLTELVTASILPESLEVSTVTPQDLEIISEMLKREPVVSDVVFPKDVVDNLIQTSSVVRFVGVSVVGFLVLFSLLVILMVIGFKIRIKRTEIEIMKLLGASPWFIQAPFIMEGVIYGVAGAIVAWIFTYLSIWYVSPFIKGNIPDVQLLPVSPLLMLLLLLVAILVATIIGFIGSYSALRRYLKL